MKEWLLAYVNTKLNLADFQTKPLSGEQRMSLIRHILYHISNEQTLMIHEDYLYFEGIILNMTYNRFRRTNKKVFKFYMCKI